MIAQKINPFVSLLRMWMCFQVIGQHFPIQSGGVFPDILMWKSSQAVPVFIFLSFFYLSPRLTCFNYSKRFLRLVIPHIVWALVYYVVYSVINLITGGNILPISCLLWQLATGHSLSLNPTMWYQLDLILLTFLFVLIYHKNNLVNIFLSASIPICFFLQYTGWNYMVFSNLRYELSYPLGRFFEILPYACSGILFFSIFQNKKVFHKTPSLFVFLLTYFISSYFISRKDFGFGYAGIELYISSCVLAMFVLSIPSEKCSKKFIDICNLVSRYTLGIYCIHRLIGRYFVPVVCKHKLGFEHTIWMCVAIYLLSYISSYCIAKITGKFARYMVS